MGCRHCGDECHCGRGVQQQQSYVLDDWMVDARNEEQEEEN